MGNNHISTIYVDMSQETLVLMGFMKGFINPNLKQCIQWIPLKGATPPFQSPVVPVDVSGRYRSIVMTNIAWKPWPIEIDGLANLKMVIFHGELLVITRW